MTRSPFSALGFALAFAASWFLAAITQVPLLWYLPLERRFTFATSVSGVGMDYYGRWLLALAAGCVGPLAGRWLPRPAPARWLTTAAVWIAGVVALTFALELALLVHRHAAPLELPSR
jgi:hypothetical protein